MGSIESLHLTKATDSTEFRLISDVVKHDAEGLRRSRCIRGYGHPTVHDRIESGIDLCRGRQDGEDRCFHKHISRGFERQIKLTNRSGKSHDGCEIQELLLTRPIRKRRSVGYGRYIDIHAHPVSRRIGWHGNRGALDRFIDVHEVINVQSKLCRIDRSDIGQIEVLRFGLDRHRGKGG